jgi:hypothetical protein
MAANSHDPARTSGASEQAARVRTIARGDSVKPVETTSGSDPMPTPSPTVICQSTAEMTSISVRRSEGIPENHREYSFPAVVKVTDSLSAQQVAAVLCRLPSVPSGARSCPADLGITYHLTFATSATVFPVVVVDATGCRDVVGGLVESRQTTDEFWISLGQAIGLPHPEYAAFRGSPVR